MQESFRSATRILGFTSFISMPLPKSTTYFPSGLTFTNFGLAHGLDDFADVGAGFLQLVELLS